MQPTIIIRYFFNVMAIALALKGEGVHPFQLKRSQLSFPQGFRSVALYGKKSSSSDDIRRKNQKDDDEYLFGSDQDCVKQFTSDDEILSSLNRKVKELELGIGKRYIIRTQRGFLNVHHEPSDPYMSENVVNQLSDGQIVTATGPTRGIWIPHDGGGWSVCKYGGFTWLEPIDD